MESFQKNRLLFWILIFLVVVNLAALVTYFLFPGKQTTVTCGDESNSPGCMLHSELNLTGEQIRLVDAINEEYRASSAPFSEQIKQLRAEILNILESDKPDTIAIDQLSIEISGLQNRLQRENIRHYLELKKVCDPEQALLLSNLYRELYGCPMHQPGSGMKHRRH